jgi:hypothetical protein
MSSGEGRAIKTLRGPSPVTGAHENQHTQGGNPDMKFPRICADEQGEPHIRIRDLPEHEACLGPPPNPAGDT